MTPKQFQENHSAEAKAFFETPIGREFLTCLHALRPPYEFPIQEHLMIANREAIRGYEVCLRNMVALMTAPKIETQVEANYGVEPVKEKE